MSIPLNRAQLLQTKHWTSLSLSWENGSGCWVFLAGRTQRETVLPNYPTFITPWLLPIKSRARKLAPRILYTSRFHQHHHTHWILGSTKGAQTTYHSLREKGRDRGKCKAIIWTKGTSSNIQAFVQLFEFLLCCTLLAMYIIYYSEQCKMISSVPNFHVECPLPKN